MRTQYTSDHVLETVSVRSCARSTIMLASLILLWMAAGFLFAGHRTADAQEVEAESDSTVEVKPVSTDLDIGRRLTNIMKSTRWFE